MKQTVLLSSAVAMLLVFGGCNGSNNSSSQNNNTEQSDSALKSPKLGDTRPLNDVSFTLGSVTFANGFELNATWGLGSAAAHKMGDDNQTFYTLTDRGVNIKCKDDEDIIGMDICDDGKIFPFPSFTPTIVKYTLHGDSVEVTQLIVLKDKDGKPISGVSNKLSNFSEKAYDINGNEMNYDPNGLDTEALAVMQDGSFWIGEEYAPSLVHVDADGKIIERLVPKGLESELSGANYTVKGILPAIIAKRHPNRGIEAIALSPDESTLYFSLQSPLDNDDYSKTRNVRMYKMALDDYNNISEYLYKLETPETFIKDNETKTVKQKKVKVSEMSALSSGKVLVLERVSKSTKIFKVDFNTATPVPSDKSANLENDDSGVTSIAKTKVFDTDTVDGYTSKIEGIASLGGDDFLLVNDNDFGIEGDKTVMKVAHFNTDSN